mmetsp:Transcript_37282/g.42584  ORF Transcript_37282/g.42584 Transcript_37282/m.42584 type:complete len:730 (+) Transcript_37282:202-2391(+)|eukprot:CAMPEP_0194141934 /NCGR_PEP_ID=MMETSP0152-20130528/11280_1 /TAXON_ID=1049557 /ORGANISM="Thalassiothrix antarctica, Strain L6-D1" /LENGTH=729 /DNA_ID=CAMNT_0038840719 /DNA_START=159 /DNA_END=2348 /DNA_ORIENTATION=+
MVRRHHHLGGLGNGEVLKKDHDNSSLQDELSLRRNIRGNGNRLKFSLENVYNEGVRLEKPSVDRTQVYPSRQYHIMAFIALLGLIIALFLHSITDNVQTLKKGRKRSTKKKKIDEWSDDYETENIGDQKRVVDANDGYFYPKEPKYPKYRKPISRDNRENASFFFTVEPNTVLSPYRSPSNSYYTQTQPDASPSPQRNSKFPAGTDALPAYPTKVQKLSPASSFASMPVGYLSDSSSNLPLPAGVTRGYQSDSSSNLPLPFGVTRGEKPLGSTSNFSLRDDLQTPKMKTKRIVTNLVDNISVAPSLVEMIPTIGSVSLKKDDLVIPFVPDLSERREKKKYLEAPQPISVEELQSEMESGNIQHQSEFSASGEPILSFARIPNEKKPSFASDIDDMTGYSEAESLDENDPRKNIIHKRKNLTLSTNTTKSLLSTIRFEELNLEEVIGGGGFGQVWRAMWRSTPVAVKVLTGSAQRVHVSRLILEEFAAEINMLKGMRHPNICLYMGACLDPPNRAIVTELAANGSLWDALRLPLQAPYVQSDGTTRTAWPISLYIDKLNSPIPPKGVWPWLLVKRVASGAARGMTYLHSGSPPVLHRDLKSANLLLDESYTTKVCDFGLSRLKAQERSMTGNCGTVQWMAPEILGNQAYAEPADVFSFGIILWELLTAECPYDGMTAIQCALAVLNRDQRPQIPSWCPPALKSLILSCVERNPSDRPIFSQVCLALDAMS